MIANANSIRIPLLDGSVHCCVTSPPYWGLRDYGLPGTPWPAVTYTPMPGLAPIALPGCDPDCEHVWGEDLSPHHPGQVEQTKWNNDHEGAGKAGNASSGNWCQRCGGWRGCLGLEPTPEMFVGHIVAIFREVKRVLRDDGVLFLNFGDSYTSSLQSSSNMLQLREDLAYKEIEYVAMEMFGVRFYGNKEAREGQVCEVLSQGICEEKDGRGQSIQGEGVKEELSKAQNRETCQDEREAQGSEVGSDRETGREMCMLRGNRSGVFDSTPRDGRRRSAPAREQEQIKQPENIQGHQTGRIPTGQVSSSVLELQLFKRMLGLLSSRTYSGNEIPDSCRFAFAPVIALKPKDLCGIPWRVAFALQADGWYLRNDIIWHKPNPMPESVTDRCTKSHEYLFLLAKSKTYFYDAEAVREKWSQAGIDRQRYGRNNWAGDQRFADPRDKRQKGQRYEPEAVDTTRGRNRRTVWEIPTHAYSGAHFATFPPALVAPCILAGTSQRGVCPECGAPWERVVERTGHVNKREPAHAPHNCPTKTDSTGWAPMTRGTDKWRPTCGHYPRADEWLEYPKREKGESKQDYETRIEPVRRLRAELLALWQPITDQRPAIVLDHFCGSGTTGEVCRETERRFVGLDLSARYLRDFALVRAEHKQTAASIEAMPLFDVTPA